jgi:hypothetical protein
MHKVSYALDMRNNSCPPSGHSNFTMRSVSRAPAGVRRFLRAGCLGCVLLTLGPAMPRAWGANFPPQGDDTTPSMGLFRLVVEPSFRILLDPSGPPTSYLGYVGYHSVDGRMTSPTLLDKTTEIGRSGRNNRFYPFPGAGIPIGAGSWDSVFGYSDYAAIPFAFFAAPANTEEVLTEIKKFILSTQSRTTQECTNTDPRVPTVPIDWPMVRAGTFAGVTPRSLGMVQGNVPNGPPGPDFPARSFFDIFVEVSLPPLPGTASMAAFPAAGAVLTNELPLIVTNFNLAGFPPQVIYIHGESATAVPLRFKASNPPYWAAGDLFGTLVLAGHGTFPADCSSEAALAAAVLGPLGTSAPELPSEWLRPTPECPPPGASYDSVRDEDILRFTLPGGPTVLARNFVHSQLNNPIPPPPPGGTAFYSSPNTLVMLEISIDGDVWLPVQAQGPVQVKIVNTSTAASSLKTFETEMLMLNLIGNTPFGPMRLRESPSRPSPGQHTLRTDPRGFRVSSFFDVALEISTDQGQNWIPAARSIRVQAGAPSAAPNQIFASRPVGANVIMLQWLGQFQLLASQKVDGPYTPVTGAAFDGLVSTYHRPAGVPGAMFFRLSQ